MKLTALVLILTLTGCTSVDLYNPQTGQKATCGPYTIGSGSEGAAMREIKCVDDFRKQGFVRVP
jgi:hypothetical protein